MKYMLFQTILSNIFFYLFLVSIPFLLMSFRGKVNFRLHLKEGLPLFVCMGIHIFFMISYANWAPLHEESLHVFILNKLLETPGMPHPAGEYLHCVGFFVYYKTIINLLSLEIPDSVFVITYIVTLLTTSGIYLLIRNTFKNRWFAVISAILFLYNPIVTKCSTSENFYLLICFFFIMSCLSISLSELHYSRSLFFFFITSTTLMHNIRPEFSILVGFPFAFAFFIRSKLIFPLTPLKICSFAVVFLFLGVTAFDIMSIHFFFNEGVFGNPFTMKGVYIFLHNIILERSHSVDRSFAMGESVSALFFIISFIVFILFYKRKIYEEPLQKSFMVFVFLLAFVTIVMHVVFGDGHIGYRRQMNQVLFYSIAGGSSFYLLSKLFSFMKKKKPAACIYAAVLLCIIGNLFLHKQFVLTPEIMQEEHFFLEEVLSKKYIDIENDLVLGYADRTYISLHNPLGPFRSKYPGIDFYSISAKNSFLKDRRMVYIRLLNCYWGKPEYALKPEDDPRKRCIPFENKQQLIPIYEKVVPVQLATDWRKIYSDTVTFGVYEIKEYSIIK